MGKRLYVGNLPYEVQADVLRRLFAQAGTVEDAVIPIDRQTARPRGFGFVEMATDQAADRAVRMFDGYDLEGRSLRVNLAEERERRGLRVGPPRERERRGRERARRRAA